LGGDRLDKFVSNKVKVFAEDLQLGMYVSELDRPWVDTPFLFQGFPILEITEIEQLRECCEFVYVDKELSQPETAKLLCIIPRKTTAKKPDSQPRRPVPPSRFSESEFHRSLQRSYPVYKDARGWVEIMLEDSRLGASIDTAKARHLVTELADEVIKNPDALIWLTHMKSRDEYTATHCINVCILALTFGRSLGLDKAQLSILGLGALLHDIGKMQVPEKILNKPARLTKEEFAIMQTHPGKGHKLLSEQHDLDPLCLDIVLHHHERLGGSGYPDGLVDKQISLLSRITAIVDVYDAVTSERCYHDAIPPALALKNLFTWAPNNFDTNLIESFIKCVGIYPVGSVVQLSTHEVGIVVATEAYHRLKPVVMLMKKATGEPYPTRRLMNLSSPSWGKDGAPVSITKVLEPPDLGIDLKALLQQELQLIPAS
jgi:putative nucleotidyltransferase with HDIG domain